MCIWSYAQALEKITNKGDKLLLFFEDLVTLYTVPFTGKLSVSLQYLEFS